MAIRLNEKTDRICTYIGRCLDFNTNSCELCKIIPSAKGDHRIEIIGYDENLATKSTGSFDVEANKTLKLLYLVNMRKLFFLSRF